MTQCPVVLAFSLEWFLYQPIRSSKHGSLWYHRFRTRLFKAWLLSWCGPKLCCACQSRKIIKLSRACFLSLSSHFRGENTRRGSSSALRTEPDLQPWSSSHRSGGDSALGAEFKGPPKSSVIEVNRVYFFSFNRAYSNCMFKKKIDAKTYKQHLVLSFYYICMFYYL